MIVINNQEEMKLYYNEKINMYLFNDDVKFICDIVVDSGINACDINAFDIKAWDIKARDINACDINACDIKAGNIKALDINARDINANKISFNAVCFAYKTFVCNAIRGRRENSKYFCLDSDVVIKSQKS